MTKIYIQIFVKNDVNNLNMKKMKNNIKYNLIIT